MQDLCDKYRPDTKICINDQIATQHNDYIYVKETIKSKCDKTQETYPEKLSFDLFKFCF